MLESFYICQHLLICGRIVLLGIIQFSTKACYRMEAHFHGAFLQEYCPKGFSASILVHFVLGIVGIVKYLQHGHSYHALLQQLKHSHLLLTLYKTGTFCVKACKYSTTLLNSFINFRKNYTKPRNDCTNYTVAGFSHSLRLFTMVSLIFRPSGVLSNLRKVVVLCRKLHFFSLQ